MYISIVTLRSRFLGSALLTLLSCGCSHGVLTEMPTSPTPTVTIKQLIVTPTGGASLIAGASQQLMSSGNTLGVGAWAQYSDGTAKYIAATWTSSDTNVIAFDGDTMRAINRGTATITARAEGMTDTETFTVEPNMAGAWSGNYIVDQCSAGSGSMTELICLKERGGSLPVGSSAPIAFQIQKSGSDLTAATALGPIQGTLRGSDVGTNHFYLSGDLFTSNAHVTVVQWNARVITDAMEGQIVFEVRINGIPSNALVVAHLDQVTRR